MIRIVGISSSPRRANTEILVKEALIAAKEVSPDIKTEFISFVGKKIEPCTDCRYCAKTKQYCFKKDDWLELIDPLIRDEPNGVIIGAPVYFFSVNAMLRSYFERCTCLMKPLWSKDFPYRPPDWTKTAAGAISIGFHRHGGEEHVLSTIHHWFLTTGFVCVGANYLGAAGWQQEEDKKDAVKKDKIGLEAAQLLGKRVAYTAQLLAAGVSSLPDELCLFNI